MSKNSASLTVAHSGLCVFANCCTHRHWVTEAWAKREGNSSTKDETRVGYAILRMGERPSLVETMQRRLPLPRASQFNSLVVLGRS